MKRSYKINLTLALLASLLAVILLGSSLSQLSLEPGTPFPAVSSWVQSAPSEFSRQENTPISFLVFQGGFAILFAFASLYFLCLLIRKARIKQILNTLLAMAAILVVVLLLSLLQPPQVQIQPAAQDQALSVPPFTLRSEPLSTPPMSWQWAVVIGGCFLLAVAAAWWVNRPPRQRQADDGVLQAAEVALQEILSGDDLRSAILRCYQRMEEAMRVEQNLERDKAMTVREFEHLLTVRGMPAQPVQQLSQIFEKVRYGNLQPSETEKNTCVACLQHILSSDAIGAHHDRS